jgi:two-component system chemotaxis sensor kinase CheA
MSDYLDPNNEELLKDFFAEAQSQVDALERNILVLENDPRDQDAVDEIFRAAHTLKGGSATVEMMELSSFTHLIEDVLDEIRGGRLSVNGDIVDVLLNAIDIVKEMLKARIEGGVFSDDISHLRGSLKSLASGDEAPPKPAKAPKQPKEPKQAQPAASPKGAGGLSEYDMLELEQAAAPGQKIYRARVRFNEEALMNTVGGIQVFTSLKDVGSVLKTVPDFESLYGDNFFPEVDYYVASSEKPETIAKRCSIPDTTLGVEILELHELAAGAKGAPAPERKPEPPAERIKAASAPERAPAKASAEPAKPAAAREPAQAVRPAEPEPRDDTQEAEDGGAAAALQAEEPRGAQDEGKEDARRGPGQASSVLRVDSRRIDNLLNLVSETVITKATFNQISNQLAELLAAFQSDESLFRERLKELFDGLPSMLERIQRGAQVKDIRKELLDRFGGLFGHFDRIEAELKAGVAKFRSTAQNLGRITGELQEGVMRIRMVPVSQIFSRFPRLVRDLSKSLDKRINLVIEGEETELDKSVIEDLLDPLMHSVRNAIDHGIEPAAERAALGKPQEGMVKLKASNEGNLILIEVSDDGRGIDVERVRQKAVERGLVHPSKTLTDIEAFNLIFEPGFSTAKTVTSISGRGVGLDVVRRQIDKLNGSVTVSSEKGKGTRFVIKLPLTLAIIQGLLVRVGKETYSIPITSVIESHRIKQQDVKMIDNYEVINIRNEVISLLRIDRLFRIPNNQAREYSFVVIVGTNEKKVGLMVDSLIGEEDVVIKPLRDQFTNSPGIAGASILGDGSVSLIIDVSQLLELGLKREIEERDRREATIR